MTNINSIYSPLLINHLLHYLYHINSLFLLQKYPLSKKKETLSKPADFHSSPQSNAYKYFFLSLTPLCKNLEHLIHSTCIFFLQKTPFYCGNQSTFCSIFEPLIQFLIIFPWFSSLFNSNNILLESLLLCYMSYHLLPHYAAYLPSRMITRMLPIHTLSFSMQMPIG